MAGSRPKRGRPGAMSDQYSLPGFDPAPKPTDRLFLAIFPDEGAARQISELARNLREELRLPGKPLEMARFHVTLHHLGDYLGLPPGLAAAVAQMAATIAMRSFEVSFDHALNFHESMVLGCGDGVPELKAFHQVLGAALEKAGLPCDGVSSNFNPHVTMQYGVGARRIDRLGVGSISWTVREFALVHSLLGLHRHVLLGRWPLQA